MVIRLQKRRSVVIRNWKMYKQVVCWHKEHSDMCVQLQWAWQCNACSCKGDGNVVCAVAGGTVTLTQFMQWARW